MALIRFDKDKIVPYIPIQERREKDPLVVHIKYVPAVVHDEYFMRLGLDLENVMDPEQKAKISQSHDKSMFVKQVAKVENFLGDDGNPIDDIAEFYDSIDYSLRQELLIAMRDQGRLTRGQRKNFEGGSDTAS